jgi:hypothetical protein
MQSTSVLQTRKSFEIKQEQWMNIYEDEELEQKLEELTNLIGRLVLDMLIIGLRKTVAENQTFSELAEAKYPISEK